MRTSTAWAGYAPLITIEFFLSTLQLIVLENRIYEQTGVLDVRSSLHYGRRFEYPWSLKQAGWPNLGFDQEKGIFSMQCEKRRGRVLDAGGGMSTFPFLLTQCYDEVYNADVFPGDSFETLEWIKEKMGFSSLHLLKQDISSLPFEDGFFDMSFCISALEHGGNDPGRIIDELLRVTAKKVLVTIDVTEKTHPEALSEPDVFGLAEKYQFKMPLPEKMLTLRTKDGSMDFNILCLCFEKE